MIATESVADREFDSLVPCLRSDLVTDHSESETIAWSAEGPGPILLDPIAAVVLRLIDDEVSVGQLVTDVHEVLGVPETIARSRLRRVIQQFDDGGLLATSRQTRPEGDEFSLFPGPLNP